MKQMNEEETESSYVISEDTPEDVAIVDEAALPTAAEEEAEAEAPVPIKKHKLFDHVILSSLVMFIVFIVFGNIIAVGAIILESQFGFGEWFNGAVTALASFLLLLWYQYHFRDEFDGLLGWSTTGLILSLPALTFVASNIFDAVKAETINPFIQCFVMACGPGFSEEIIFRGIPGSNAMRVHGSEKGILPNVLITAVVFGLVHGLNILQGAALSSTIFQIFYAFALGVFFEAVILRCGSIWPTIIMHTLIDLSSFLFMDMAASGIITEELTYNLQFFVVVGFSVILFVLGLYLVRPAKRPEIVDLWKKKWHRVA